MPPNNSPLGQSDGLNTMPKAEAVNKPVAPIPPPSIAQRPAFVPPSKMPDRPDLNVRSTVAMQPKKHGKLGLIIFIILILLIGGVGAYAYFTDMLPPVVYSLFSKAPYDKEKLASSIFGGIGNIKSSSYSLNLTIVAEPKDADAEVFKMAVPSNPEKVAAYKRDQDRVRDILSIIANLSDYYYKKKLYPDSLIDLPKITSLDIEADPTNLPYKYYRSENGSDFVLTVQFETADAVDSIKSQSNSGYGNASSTTINGKMVTFTKSSYSYVYLPAEPKQPAIADIMNMQSALNYIPADFRLDGTMSGASEKVDDKTTNAEVGIKGSTDFGDINVSIDLAFKKIADNIYILISKFPSFFFDISKLKGKWIKATPQDLATYGQGYSDSSNDPKEEIEKKKQEAAENIKLFLSLADKNHALISAGEPVFETVDGMKAYRYDLEFNKDTMPQFYTDLTDEFQKKYQDKNLIKFDQATLDYLKSPEFSKTFEYFRKNTTLIVWADRDGIPVQAKYSIRMVPDAKQKADKQIRLTLTLTLHDVNQPVTIEEPKDSMSFEDATLAVTGQTKEQYKFSKAKSAVQTVQSALNTYRSLTGVFPATLDDLKKTRGDLKKTYPQNDSTQSVYGYSYGKDTDPILKVIPNDVFTEKPFEYTSKGTDFALIYTMALPKYEKGTYPTGIYTYEYVPKGGTKLVMTAVQGKNTANSKSISEEASQSQLDTDKDGLSDDLENYIGTDKSKKDTDGDGYSDNEELTRGSDPLGPGKLTGSAYGY